MLKLDDVSLALVNGTDNISGSVRSMERCLSNTSFAESILFSPTDFSSDRIRGVKIDSLDWMGYNHFIVKELYHHINTEFVLIVQEDGFIVNTDMWTDEFMEYDYLGAPWTDHMIRSSEWIPDNIKNSDNLNYVGNGGFSFRSKKLLKSCVDCPHEVDIPEDNYICIMHRDFFDSQGIKFAPTELADRFSYDNWAEQPNENLMTHFGVHGVRFQ